MKSSSNGKVGIITLHGYHNYGNKLQNYALQESIKKLGFDVATVIISLPREKRKHIVDKISKLFTIDGQKKIFNRICKLIKYYFNKGLEDKRIKVFKSFSNEYLLEMFYDYNNETLTYLANKFDFFITGSDQVWNPIYKNELPIYFLTFCRPNQRLSYAPSFGQATIPKEYEDKYRAWLSEMKALSVREESGAKIIKDLTGRDAPVVVDPTLLISKEHWLSIAKKASNRPDDDYILTYFLGKVSAETKKQIKYFSKKYKMRVISLADLNDKDTYVAGPSEFIDYINSASILLTDSFHGVVFSILLEKPFIVYERLGSSMYSRIETLLEIFNLRSREVRHIKNADDIFNIDYSHVAPILEAERNKALNYLREAFNIQE